jgi:serine/threonine protein phosphatase 1
MEQPIYAMGDIHGQLDKLTQQLDWIERDGGSQARVVFLGDYIDRGPDSKGVIDTFLNGLAQGRDWRFCKGNHDRYLQRFLSDRVLVDPVSKLGLGWLHPRIGGIPTLASYMDVGALPHGLEQFADTPPSDAQLEDLHGVIREQIPQSHVDFFNGLKTYHQDAGFIFVHAGLKPGVPLAQQDEDDLLWIRKEFHDDNSDHGGLVVHGHTPVKSPDLRHNRLNLDTGAGHGAALSTARLTERDRFLLTAEGRLRL